MCAMDANSFVAIKIGQTFWHNFKRYKKVSDKFAIERENQYNTYTGVIKMFDLSTIIMVERSTT